jgi:hypothetical protein
MNRAVMSCGHSFAMGEIDDIIDALLKYSKNDGPRKRTWEGAADMLKARIDGAYARATMED